MLTNQPVIQLSKTAKPLTQNRAPHVYLVKTSTRRKEGLEVYLHCLTYYSGYFYNTYGNSKDHKVLDYHRRIASHAVSATNALAEIYALVEKIPDDKYRDICTEARKLDSSFSGVLCRGVPLSKRPQKTTPWGLAIALAGQAYKLKKHLQYFPSLEANEQAQEAYYNLSAIEKELESLLFRGGWTPRWPKHRKSTANIEAWYE